MNESGTDGKNDIFVDMKDKCGKKRDGFMNFIYGFPHEKYICV